MSIKQRHSMDESDISDRSSISVNTITHNLGKFALALVIPVALSCATATRATAVTLWYNGDPNGQGSTRNEIFGTVARQATQVVFDDFVVPSTDGGWNINSVFSNNLIDPRFPVTNIYWAFANRNPAPGPFIPEDIFASGISPATVIPTTFTVSGQPVYTLSVSDLNIHLDPGTYWLGVAPQYELLSTVIPNSAIATTSGSNAIGIPPGNDGNSFLLNYFSVSPGNNLDYSMGIIGTTSKSVPEPSSTLSVLTFGAFSVGALLKRKQKLASGVKSNAGYFLRKPLH